MKNTLLLNLCLSVLMTMALGSSLAQKVYAVDYPNQAGWQKAAKKNWMY